MSGWKTPILPASVPFTCRRLSIPDILEIKDAVFGALYEVLDAANWEESGSSTEDVIQLLEQTWLETAKECYMLIGVIVPNLWQVLPDWALPCDGSIYAKADYPDLIALCPWAVFSVDADNFKTPDLRGRYLRGVYPSLGLNMGDIGGLNRVTLTEDEIPSHAHQYQQYTFGIDIESVGVPDPTGVGQPLLPAQTGSAGGGQSHENNPPFMAVSFALIAK